MKRAEENKLIIEFMGHKIDQHEFVTLPEFGGRFNTSTVRYDKDWHWLMSVVSKINEKMCTEHYMRAHGGYDFLESTKFESHLLGARLKDTYEAIVEFITWYNENKSELYTSDAMSQKFD